MFYLLRELNTRKFTHRTYVVSSGDAFSAQRAVEFEKNLEECEELVRRNSALKGEEAEIKVETPACLGPDHYNLATIPRAGEIHQSLFTTPFSCLWTFYSAFTPLLRAPPLLPNQAPTTPYEAVAADLPDLIITNGPATAVIVILASLILRYVNWRGANSSGKCKTVYVESFARVKTLSLSGKLLLRIVDRFLVQWEELEGTGGRAEFCGVLV